MKIIITLGLSYLFARLIITNHILSVIAAVTILMQAFYAMRLNNVGRIYSMLFILLLPVPNSLFGHDIMLFIVIWVFLIIFISMIEKFNRRSRSISDGIEKLIYLLSFLTLFTLFSSAGESNFLLGVRQYLIFLIGIGMFLYLVKAPIDNYIEESKMLEIIMDLTLLLTFLNIITVFFVSRFPVLGSFLQNISSSQDDISFSSLTDGVSRLRFFMAGPEGTGELLAVLSPLAIYKYLTKNKIIYVIVYAVFFMANILTATRSTILLFIMGSLVTCLFCWKWQAVNVVKLGFSLSVLMLIFILIKPDFIEGALHRFSLVKTNVKEFADISYVLNREIVWREGLAGLRNAGFLGQGFIPPDHSGEIKVNFHNLYLTRIYQIGWIGALIFFIIWVLIYLRLWRMQTRQIDRQKIFLLRCFMVALTILLVNEMKYEFTRYPRFEYLYLFLFGIAYRLSRNKTADQL